MKRIFPWSLLALLIGGLGFGAWRGLTWWQQATSPPLISKVEGSQPPGIRVEIPPGTPVQQIGSKLEDAGIIRSATAWNLWSRWLRLRRETGDFQAGIYKLSPASPMEEIASKIWRGEVMQQSFTIPEGWSIDQMGKYFEKEGFFSAKEFVDATRQVPYAQFPWLPSGLPHLEGYLYPDTYQLSGEEVTPQAAIAQMLRRFEQVALSAYRQGKNPLQLTLQQWVTLGSIVEKESVVPQERQRIAGVFTQRLKKGMKLESDPTVEYALGIRQTVDKPLTFAQVETPSPYNTYMNTGLPPTPIASPGIASLEATLSPEETEYLYFMARYDGTHIFSKTFAEHEEAIANVEQKLNTR